MSEGSLKVLLDFRRRVASIMREHDAVRVDVLRPALAVVGVLSGGTSTYACIKAWCNKIDIKLTKHTSLQIEIINRSPYRPSICHRPVFARVARWWLRGMVAVAALALGMRDSARTLRNPRCSADLEGRFRRCRRARYRLLPMTFDEHSAATKRDSWH